MPDPNLKSFGSQDRPLILDFSQLARKVIWGSTNNYAVLLFSWRRSSEQSSDYPFTLTGLPFGNTWNMNADFKRAFDHAPKPDTLVVESEFTKDMRNNLLVFEYIPQKTSKTETQTLTATVADLSHWVGYIGGGFPFFGGNFRTGEEAYASFSIGFRQLTGRDPNPLDPTDLWVGATAILESHVETTTRTTHTKSLASALFMNLPLIGSKFLDLKAPVLEFKVLIGSSVPREGVRWSIDVYTFKGNKKFPVTRKNDTTQDPPVAQMIPDGWPGPENARSFTKFGGGDFPPLPLSTLTVRIDCVTLKITKAQLTP